MLRRLAASMTVAIVVLGLSSVSALAEGSRDLYPTDRACTATTAGACRTNLEWRTGTYGPAGSTILRRTVFSVYLTAGEVLETGSSAVGVGSGDVLVYNPGVITNDEAPGLPPLVPGTNGFTCSDQRTQSGVPSQGRITSRAMELAGPRAASGGGNPAGYVPCTYTASTTGIYKAVFFGPVGANGNTDGAPTGEIPLTSASNFSSAQGTSVSSWDLTVRPGATSTVDLPGRVFTYALTAFTGNNGRPVDQTVYSTSTDGYQYRVDTNGLDPNGFVLYGNEKGFLAPDGVTPLNHDVLGSNGQLATVQGGVSLAAPEYPLSFEQLAPATLAALGIGAPIKPQITGLAFTGSAGGNNSRVGHGGTFALTQNVHGTYSIVISRDGVNLDPGNPLNRVLTGVTDAGTQSIVWDGNDNNGGPFPVGTNYTVQAELQAGVNHFPLIDAENSMQGGPSFTLLNPPGGVCPFGNAACTTAFYDDRGYHTDAGGVAGTDVGTPGATLCGNLAPSPDHSDPKNGFVSTSAQRRWGAATGGNTNASCTGNFGDAKGLDTWTFFPSNQRSSVLNILPLPPTPVATDDSTVTAVDVPVTVPAAAGLLGNDTGDGITVTAHTSPGHGQVVVQPDGAYTYTPDPGFVGTDTFDYTITDSEGRTSTATVTITVKPPPVARDDVGTTPVNTPFSGPSVLGNDIGPGLVVTSNTAPAHGTVVVTPDGTYVYTPGPDYSGPDSFTYTVTAAGGDTATATVHLNVTPAATDDVGTTPVNTSLTGASVLGNDHGTGLSVTASTHPAHGTVVVNPDGTYVYTPDLDYTGPDAFTYTTTDASGATATATVRLTVTPTATDDTGVTPVDTPLTGASVLGNDHGTGLSVTDSTQPAHGTVVVGLDGTYVYTPAAGFTGPDSFTYTATDASGATTTATVSLTITPVATDDATTTPVNTPVTLDPLSNDRGTGLSISAVTQPPANEGTVAVIDGKVVFTPANGFTGIAHYTYTVIDSAGQTAAATDTITVTPRAVPDHETTPVNVPVTLNPLSNDLGTALRLTSVTQPPANEGSVAIVDGTIVFTPATDFTGIAHFGYTVSDASGQTATTTDTVTVVPAAAAAPDTATTTQGTPVTIDPLANDSGRDSLRPSTIELLDPATGEASTTVVTPGKGTWSADPASGLVTFTPTPDFTGVTTVTYRVLDTFGRLHLSTITVTVTASGGTHTGIGGLVNTGADVFGPIGLAIGLLLAGFGLLITVSRGRSN